MFEQSKWFYEEFSKIFAKDSEDLQEAITIYQNNTKFTKFIIERINKIIKTKNNDYCNEYFRIDAMGYKSHYTDLKKISNFNQHLWDLEIAVEHENDKKDWLDEVIKLAHICCPLRVVIGYVSIKNGRDDATVLNIASTALQKLKCIENVKNGEFLVILGNADTEKGDIEKYFNYEAYVLDKESLEFKPLYENEN